MEKEKKLLKQLLNIHKLLIEVEKARHNEEHGTLAEGNQLLQLLIKDPKFAWLQVISNIILQLEFALEKSFHDQPRFKRYIYEEIYFAFFSDLEETEFSRRYQDAVEASTALLLEHRQIRETLSELYDLSYLD